MHAVAANPTPGWNPCSKNSTDILCKMKKTLYGMLDFKLFLIPFKSSQNCMVIAQVLLTFMAM